MSRHTFEAYSAGYDALWKSMGLTGRLDTSINKQADKILAGKSRYMELQSEIGVPWYVVGLMHVRESNCNFSRHLHNGDPLTGRTTRVPAGHPKEGSPPFTWHESALDALKLKNLDKITDWSLARVAYTFEQFNGFGYRQFGINSPYLWSGSNHYTRGKYVADHVFNSQEVDKQVGTMSVLKVLMEKDPTISFSESTPPSVTNSQKSARDIIKNSKTLSFLNAIKAAIISAFTSWWLLFKEWITFDNAAQLKTFLSDNVGWIMLGSGFVLVVIIQYLQNSSVKTFQQGQWSQAPTETKNEPPSSQ